MLEKGTYREQWSVNGSMGVSTEGGATPEPGREAGRVIWDSLVGVRRRKVRGRLDGVAKVKAEVKRGEEGKYGYAEGKGFFLL